MSLLQSTGLIIATIFLFSSSLNAMDNKEKPDFIICNLHNQNVKVSFAFEYKESGEYIAEHNNISISAGYNHPFFLNHLLLINSDSKKQAVLSELNLEYMIIRIDRPIPLDDEPIPAPNSEPSSTGEDDGVKAIDFDIAPGFQPGGAALVYLERITHLEITESETSRLKIKGWNAETEESKSV